MTEEKVKRLASPFEIIYLDEIAEKLDDLQKTLEQKLDKMLAFNTVQMSPMRKMFRRDQQYQFATIPAGRSGQVYLLENPQPELFVGIISQVGNLWYPHTYLEWTIDEIPKRVEYQIAPVNNPKEYEKGIPFDWRVIWTAYNNDTVSHVFEVLCDGYFVERKLYRKILEDE